jgi:Fe-S-cluster-containing dehydrogenase component/DMSO reductase anchor subunit
VVTNLHPDPSPTLRTLVDELIAEQAALQTPVARFSEQHDRAPDLADHYRTLIPLSKPGLGEQYAFEVSLDRCTGCKACVSACHSLNGLDDHEAWRDTGVLLGGDSAPAWQQTVTTACHHCEDPGCMNGCPVGAYEKDGDTGIVRHLDDQCIGCSYCILKCPYDVPKYSKKRGIVRKCDMCHQRLAVGEAPACVQACPTEAIRIVTVGRLSGSRHGNTSFLTPIRDITSAIPDPSITVPTTRYAGREVPATAYAADRAALVPQHAHWPLVLMLALTQCGVGLLIGGSWNPSAPLMLGAAGIFNLGMIAAVFHLGQPLKAWRFFLGLKTSWLSREILAFSMFAPIPMALCALAALSGFPKSPLPSVMVSWLPLMKLVLAASVLVMGLAAVFTSVMIYVDTKRPLWSLPRTAARFFGATISFALLAATLANPIFKVPAMLGIVLTTLPEIIFLTKKHREPWSPDLHSQRLMLGPLRLIVRARFALTLLAIPALCFSAWIGLPMLLAATILERQLFFQAVQAPKMPGGFGPAARRH